MEPCYLADLGLGVKYGIAGIQYAVIERKFRNCTRRSGTKGS